MAEADTNFDSVFGAAAEKLREAAAARGIKTHYISGRRSRQDQEELYANYQAGLHDQPLPYPTRGAVPLAARPGTSLHERGLAADIVADDPGQEATLRSMAQQFGLRTIGPKDPNHFELARAGGPAVDTTNSVAAPAGATTLNSRPGFLDSLARIESNNQNIFSGVDKDYPNQPGSRSQGYYQIDTPTWQQFAAKAGVDISKYPSAMNAPREVQAQVASLIPLSRFGARTQRMLGQQYGQLDTGKTIGELATSSGGATAIASAAPAPTPSELLAKGDVGGAVKALWTKPPPKTDAQGNQVEQKSTLENVADAFGSKGGEERGPAPIPEMPAAPVVTDPTPGLAPAAQQLWSTVAQAAAKPLSWTSDPYGANAGLQRIRQGGGTTLNNTGYGYG